jgi:hypothetical protein
MRAGARATVIAAAALLSAGGCGGGAAAPDADAGSLGDAMGVDGGVPDGGGDGGDANPPQPGGYSLPGFPDGVDFFIQLPPSFSPFLPLSGDEATREPAAFYDTTSDYFFSYGFIWWLTGSPDLSTTGLGSDLRTYFVGLCGTSTPVALTLDEPVPAGSARRAGTLDVGNGQPGSCFGNPVPPATLDVSTFDCPDHQAVIVLVSPQPQSSQVWTDLRAIRDGFLCW